MADRSVERNISNVSWDEKYLKAAWQIFVCDLNNRIEDILESRRSRFTTDHYCSNGSRVLFLLTELPGYGPEYIW